MLLDKIALFDYLKCSCFCVSRVKVLSSSSPFRRFSLGVFCLRVFCASRILDIRLLGSLEDWRYGRASLFLDDSVASERACYERLCFDVEN